MICILGLTAEIESRAKEIMARVLAEQDGIDPERLDEEENLLEKYYDYCRP